MKILDIAYIFESRELLWRIRLLSSMEFLEKVKDDAWAIWFKFPMGGSENGIITPRLPIGSDAAHSTPA